MFAILSFVTVYGVDRKITGKVIDSLSHEPVPYASVKLKNAGWGKLTDPSGKFSLENVSKGDTIVVSAMGFSPKTVVYDGRKKNLQLEIVADGLRLNEVVVRPKKEKYSKHNNPAVDFVNRIRKSYDMTDPRRNPFYGYDKYERITIALNDINPESDKNLILKKFDFLREHIDTSEVSGKPILNISTREKMSHHYYRKDPRSEKEIIGGVSQRGLDDFLDEENMRVLYEDFFNDIDLYQNDVYLLHNKFVSPLSKIGPDFYKYYLTDTLDIGGEKCVELSFVPHNSQSFGFTGKVYVPVADTTMFIKKVVMNVPKDINVNFIDRLYISQEYEKAADGSRLLKRDDLTVELNVISGMQGLYFRRNTAYDNHNFVPADEVYVYDIPGRSIMAGGSTNRDETYWESVRLIPMKRSEQKVSEMATEVRRVPLYYWGEKILKIFALGYINTSKESRFDIGPVNTMLSHNSVEGFRLRLGGMTTANLSKRLFVRGYGAYGIKDHKWKYGGELEYSFVDKRYHPREFPIHALRFSASYDVDMLGQHYAFTNADNMFLSFKRKDDYQMTYLRSLKLTYILENANNFSLTASFLNDRQEASPYMKFVNGNGRIFSHYTESGFSIELRYAPGEKFYQTKTGRISITPEKPAFLLTHTYCPKGFMGNLFEINKTEISISKRFWLSAFGYIDGIIKGGHLWSQSPYPNLIMPNANLSYTIQPESFAMMNPMEFMTDSYAMWDVTYWANGAIFNYIPLLKKLKLREAFSFRGFFGHLSHKNRPDFNSDLFLFPDQDKFEPMTHTPYMEAGVGIDNIFKILRVDYVWRLNYRNRPDIDKSGLRVALHFTF